MAELYVVNGGKSKPAVEILAATASNPSLEDEMREQECLGLVPWVNNDGEIDVARLISDIEEHNEWIDTLIVARDMRKTILRLQVLKDGKLSMKVGEKTVNLKPRSYLACTCHHLQVGECGTAIEDVRLERRVIEDPIQRSVIIERPEKKAPRIATPLRPQIGSGAE